jgi:hypothetical protein
MSPTDNKQVVKTLRSPNRPRSRSLFGAEVKVSGFAIYQITREYLLQMIEFKRNEQLVRAFARTGPAATPNNCSLVTQIVRSSLEFCCELTRSSIMIVTTGEVHVEAKEFTVGSNLWFCGTFRSFVRSLHRERPTISTTSSSL